MYLSCYFFRSILAVALLLAAAAVLTPPRVQAQNGVDPVFGGSSLGLSGFIIHGLALQTDGKIVLGGRNGSLLRFNTDGSVDTRFHPPSQVTASALAVRSDGAIVVGGGGSLDENALGSYSATLNPDGSLLAGGNVLFFSVLTLAVQPDGKVIVGGYVFENGDPGSNGIERLNADGSMDLGFNPQITNGPPKNDDAPTINSVVLQADGKILIGGQFTRVGGTAHRNIARLNADGTADNTFAADTDDEVRAIALQPDGRIVVAGIFTKVGSVARNQIARLETDGTLDGSFDAGIVVDDGTFSSGIGALAIQANGQIVIGQGYTKSNGVVRSSVARLNTDGCADPAFHADVTSFDTVDAEVQTVLLQPDGKILISGIFTLVNGGASPSLARLNPDGSSDKSFVVDLASGPNAAVDALALQPNGKVVLAGDFTLVNGALHNHLVRLNNDATPDPTFNANTRGTVNALAVQSDGKMVIGGSIYEVNGIEQTGVARLNPDGTTDTGFVGISHPYFNAISCLRLQADGKIVSGGNFVDSSGRLLFGIERLNPDGTPDSEFNGQIAQQTGVTGLVYALAVLADGRILVGGELGYSGLEYFGLVGLHPDGTLDGEFNPRVVGFVYSLAVQSDGKIVISGNLVSIAGTTVSQVARLNLDGSLDDSFHADVTDQGSGSSVTALLIQPDGKILVGGSFAPVNGNNVRFLTRLNADGSRDPFFTSSSGTNDTVNAFALQTDEKILLGGNFTQVDGVLRNYVARLTASGTPDFFGGGAAVDVGGGFYYMEFSGGNPFGYYNLAGDGYSFPYLYHADLGMEYFFDAQDGFGGAYFYDFASSSFFYSSPKFAWPYLYDFTLKSVLYYYPDPSNPGRYNTGGVRYFYNFATGQIITK